MGRRGERFVEERPGRAGLDGPVVEHHAIGRGLGVIRWGFGPHVRQRRGGHVVRGIDARGRGGRVAAKRDRTDGWAVPVTEIVLACVEGQPWKQIARD